jgi:hypothetical protein
VPVWFAIIHDTSAREQKTRIRPTVRSRQESHIRLCAIFL